MAKSPRVKTPKFAEQARVVLKGSEKAAPENAADVKPTPAKSKVTVSVIVRRKEPLKINKRGGRANGPVRLSRAEYKKQHAADPDAFKQVKAFAKEFNLKVEDDPTAALRRTEWNIAYAKAAFICLPRLLTQCWPCSVSTTARRRSRISG